MTFGNQLPLEGNDQNDLKQMKRQSAQLTFSFCAVSSQNSPLIFICCDHAVKKGEGLRGLQGLPGKAGPQGLKGEVGPQGEKGQKGERGIVVTDDLHRQITDLEAKIRVLEDDLSRYKKALSLKDVVNVGKKMFVSTGKKYNFEKGKSLCAKAGSVLASPRNEAENTALKDLVDPSSQAYIGISDAQTEGRFMYLSGGPLTYSNWKPGEPNNHKNEDCAVIEDSGKWNDLDCSNSNIFIICEL